MLRAILVLSLLAGFCCVATAGGTQPRLPRDNLLIYRGGDGKPVPVQRVEEWAKRRAEVVRGMESVMGKLPGEAKRCPLDMKVEEEIDGETYVRRLVTYARRNRVAACRLTCSFARTCSPARKRRRRCF